MNFKKYISIPLIISCLLAANSSKAFAVEAETSENTSTETEVEKTTEPTHSYIEIKGNVPTLIIDENGYLVEKYMTCYETTFETDKDLSLKEAFSIILESKNDFFEAEKEALLSLDISEECPEKLIVDIYYNADETKVEKISTSYTLKEKEDDEDENTQLEETEPVEEEPTETITSESEMTEEVTSDSEERLVDTE